MGKAKNVLHNSQKVSWIRGKCLGQGSFGTVHLAVDKSNGDHVFAVKSVDQTTCVSSQLLALENEIQTLRSLSSPYVVDYLGDDRSYEGTTTFRNLHMEYLPGGTAADVAGKLDEKTVRSLTWCIVSALKYVHSKGIVHCDVKGRNILLDQNSPNVNAKLADFGSAVEVSGCKSEAPIVPRGSPLWMAPEVVRRESQGSESDIWSLGCTVIEMITGKPAWEDRGVDTLNRIGFSDDLPEFPAGLSEVGRDFLGECLNRDPKQRWSCDQLLQHPFLASIEPNSVVIESSPRCVLDWINSEFEIDNDDDEEYCCLENSIVSFDGDAICSIKEKIGKLATNSGANWESDGWMDVRTLGSVKESEEENYEIQDLARTETEIVGTSPVYWDSVRTGLEYLRVSASCLSDSGNNFGDNGGLIGYRDGLSWIEDRFLVVERRIIFIFYRLYIGVLYSYCLMVLMNKLNYFISYMIYWFKENYISYITKMKFLSTIKKKLSYIVILII